MFDKMAILQSSHGKICAVDVMDGTANDLSGPKSCSLLDLYS